MEDEATPLITVSGPPAAGTSTLTKQLARDLEFEVINGGDIFRRIADERDLTLAELTRLSEEDDSIDKELDARLEQIIEDHVEGRREPAGCGLIVESRLAGWHADGRATLAVFLDAPRPVRVERIDSREETVAELAEREQSEAKRYKEYYGIDISDMSIYDLVLNTGDMTPEEVTTEVKDELDTFLVKA